MQASQYFDTFYISDEYTKFQFPIMFYYQIRYQSSHLLQQQACTNWEMVIRKGRAGPTHSLLAIENSTWLEKSTFDEFSGEATKQLSTRAPAGVP